MRKTLFYLLASLPLLGVGLKGLQAQQTIPATGGNASGSGGSASYTIGQITYTTNTGTNGSVAQGVQQPYEISVVNGIAEAKDIVLQCSAYPNPVTDIIKLNIGNLSKSNMNYQLFDNNGKLLESKKIANTETSINMHNLATATYFIRINDKDNAIKTFKIIKK